MKQKIGTCLLYSGAALVAAAAIRAVADLLQAEPFDPWSAVLALGCILMSIGLGVRRAK
ncbi:MAG: hypothetical protein ACE5NG_03485 [bacterium]